MEGILIEIFNFHLERQGLVNDTQHRFVCEKLYPKNFVDLLKKKKKVSKRIDKGQSSKYRLRGL